MNKEIVFNSDAPIRIDKYLVNILENFSRTDISKFIKSGNINVNNKNVSPSYILKTNDNIIISCLDFSSKNVDHDFIINILFENDDFYIIEKPANLPIYFSSKFDNRPSLLKYIIANKFTLSTLPEEANGIVHRLDKDTSGLMIIAKTNYGYKVFKDLFKKKEIKKEYITLVSGTNLPNKGKIDLPISRNLKNRTKMCVNHAGRSSISNFEVLDVFDDSSLLSVQIETGRTHQIRVHFNYISHCVIGDSIYGNCKLNDKYRRHGLKRQFLHASKLEFKFKNKIYSFESELSDDLKSVLNKLSN